MKYGNLIAFMTYTVSLGAGIFVLSLGEREIGLMIIGAALGGGLSYPVGYTIGKNGAK